MESPTAEDKANRAGEVSMKRGSSVVVILVAALVLTAVVAVVLLIALATRGFGTWQNRVCQTRECVRASARIASYMDESVDPCQDFYKYACGEYEKMHVIPTGSATVNPWSTLSAELLVKLKSLFEYPSKIDHLNIVKQAKNYYKSCMNETAIEELGVRPLLEYVRQHGGWALLDDNFNEASFDLETYIAKIGIDSMPSIITAMIGPSPNKSEENIFHIGQGVLSLGNRNYYLKAKADNQILKTYEKTTVELAVMLGGEEKMVREEVAKMIDFETELAKLTVPAADRQAATNTELMSVEQIQNTYPGIDCIKIVKGFLSAVNITLAPGSFIGVSDDAYLRKVGDLIGRTPKKTLSIYVMFRGIATVLDYTDKDTRKVSNQLRELTRGTVAEKPRYEICSERTNARFPYVTARIFVDEYFTGGTDDVKDITERLKTVFKDNLGNLDWLDEASRQEARGKVDAMAAKLAYPNAILNDELLEKESHITDIKMDQYLQNSVRLMREDVTQELKKSYAPVDRSRWRMPPVTVNAFYNPPGNMILFPLGILQPPFYDMNGLKVLNYAAIGEVIGHEVTHGFDNNGRIYDKNGNKREWMSKASIDNFNELAQCIIQQYSNMTIPEVGLNVDGKLTQGENIADVGALKQSFQAYQNWVTEHGAEKSLPGLDLSASQLFFLSYSQMYCHLITPELLRLLLEKDSHTPMRERVHGTLINSVEFSDAYNCPVGSRMNPGRRCTIW